MKKKITKKKKDKGVWIADNKLVTGIIALFVVFSLVGVSTVSAKVSFVDLFVQVAAQTFGNRIADSIDVQLQEELAGLKEDFDDGIMLGSSNSIPSNYFTVGDLTTFTAKVPLSTGTTTVCTITAPAATSTLVVAGVRFSISSSTASLITIAKAARDTNATTTILGNQIAVDANAQDTIIASTTSAQDVAEARIFAPYERLIIGMQGSGEGTYSPVGVCFGEFKDLNSF